VSCEKWANWTSGVGVGQKIRLHLPVFLWIQLRLHPKISDSLRLRLRLRLRNAVSNYCLSCLNCILTITQACWDVSGAEATFTTHQKLFSNFDPKNNLLMSQNCNIRFNTHFLFNSGCTLSAQKISYTLSAKYRLIKRTLPGLEQFRY